MEGHVDAFKGDGGEAPLEVYGGRLGGGHGGAFADDREELLADFFEGEGREEGGDVDFLRF